MRVLRSVLVIGLFTVIGVLVRATPACACTCREFTPEEALASAGVVFAGTVVDIHSSATGPIFSSADPVRVAFEVDTVHKGDVPEAVQVQTVASEISCGYEFREQTRYLVYVHVDQAGQWTTGLCSGNQVLNPWAPQASDDRSANGDRAPSEVAPSDGVVAPVDQPRERPLLLVLAGGLAAAAGVLAVLFVLRVRRRRAATITSA